MEPNEKKALDRCYADLLRDLNPSLAFLQHLRVKKVLTEDIQETVVNQPTRETKVAELIKHLPTRGPRAFNAFKQLLEKDYSWIARKMEEEHQKLESESSIRVEGKIMKVIEQRLVPLVKSHHNAGRIISDQSNFDLQHPNRIMQYLNDLLTTLTTECHNVIQNNTDANIDHQPLCILIENALQDTKLEVKEEVTKDLKLENEQLKKMIKDLQKSKSEHEQLKNQIRDQKQLRKENDKLKREAKKSRQEIEKIKNENKRLKVEIFNLEAQIQSM